MNQHFAIGLSVCVRKGAKPYGWPDYEDFGGVHWSRDDYGRPAQITAVDEPDKPGERTSYEVLGWHWLPEDLHIPNH